MKLRISKNGLSVLVTALALLFAIGCGGGSGEGGGGGGTDASTSGSASLPDGLFLASAPAGIKPIAELKQSAKEGDTVVVRVVVGGSEEPLVASRASAMIMDASLENLCLADDDHCPAPWDYCCSAPEDKIKNLATLQVVDSDGRVLAAALDTELSPGATLVVKGIVGARANDQMLPINATGIFIEKTALK